jgi:peroxiredoxin
MKRPVRALLALTLALAATPALAALKPGERAPAFATTVALGGKDTNFSLAEALKKGPVVLYFFPAAFTKGCDIEAGAFADAADEFKAAGATIVGMTGGNVDRIREFSTEKCRSKFAVGAASKDLIKKYDTALAVKPGWSNRTSYVIAPDGKIIYAHSEMSPEGHITGTLDAVKKWRAAQKR